jgi:hypothetical protein
VFGHVSKRGNVYSLGRFEDVHACCDVYCPCRGRHVSKEGGIVRNCPTVSCNCPLISIQGHNCVCTVWGVCCVSVISSVLFLCCLCLFTCCLTAARPARWAADRHFLCGLSLRLARLVLLLPTVHCSCCLLLHYRCAQFPSGFRLVLLSSSSRKARPTSAISTRLPLVRIGGYIQIQYNPHPHKLVSTPHFVPRRF